METIGTECWRPEQRAGGGRGIVRTEATGLLAAGLAHDLNNMLGGILATAELLQLRVDEGSEEWSDLAAIATQAGRASDLVRKILAFSRQEVLVPVVEPIDRLLDQLLPLLRPLAGARLERLDGCGPSALVRIDAAALERTVVNLVLNACTAAGADGRVRVAAARIAADGIPPAARSFMPAQDYGVLVVEDDGPGVAPEHEAHIFDPYFTTRKDGQGLGLSSAYGLVKQSGGFLLYDRSPLGGARFTIYLPEADPVRQQMARMAPDLSPAILLAEDDMLLRMSVARGLERMGYRVRQAADGTGAMNRLGSEQPSLLLADIRMPGMDGVQLARAARRLYPDLPVLLVSAYGDEGARAAVPGLGVSFLAKPFTLAALSERLRALL